jgi:hypothetical protein
LMITDHSLRFGSQGKYFRQLKHIPKKFGLYKNFQIWQRLPKKQLTSTDHADSR